MVIFWQITIVESLLNVAVFAVAVIAFGLVRQFLAQLHPQSKLLHDCVVGVLLGAATAVALLLPVHLNGGASTGTQTILLALAGPVAGPVAAVFALVIAIGAQLLPLTQDGGVEAAGIAASVVAVTTGIVFQIALKLRSKDALISYFHFPALGLASALTGLGTLWWYQGWAAARGSATAAIIAGTLGATMLGTLLLHEIRRHKAEQDLRESQSRLALKTRELAVARDLAEQANRSKSSFLANMSHELRTPLNAILGFSEMISTESLGPVGTPKYKEYAGDIHVSGSHLLSLINDLLDVAKIESGKMEISPNRIEPQKIFDAVKTLVGVKAEEKRQLLTMVTLADAPALYADERALKQILINLISNAVKYTPAGGEIRVTATKGSGGTFQLVCEDTGPGIPREKLANIFTPFSQVDNCYNRQAGGTGLGLSLVRGLTEMHGGRAWLESEFGKGCRAYVELPVAPPTQAAATNAVAA